MALKVCVVSLLVVFLSCAHGAAIPSELMNQVQDFLVNPEPLAAAVGMRVKRDTGDWDKEFDMEALGLSFKLKYVDPSNPIKGGHVLMKFPAHRFVKAASFDDVELEFDFKGGEAVDGLFEMKFDYKFIQKFTFFADHPQEGTVTMYRKMEGGKWMTKMSLVSNTKKLFEVNMESDHATNFHGKATYDHDNTWEITINRVPGKSIEISFLQNGVGYTIVAALDKAAWKANVKVTIPGKTFHLDVQLNPAGKWGVKMTGDINGPLGVMVVMSKDFKQAELNIKHRENVYAHINLVGNVEMNGIIPKKFKYATTYKFVEGPGFTMQKEEGQAKVRFDGFSDKKVFTVEFTPTGGVDGKVDLSLESTNPGFKYMLEITQGGKSYFKQEGTRTVTADDADKWQAIETSHTFMAQDSPIYKWHCKYMTYPVPCATSSEQTQKYFFDKKNKNFLLNKFSYESDIIFGGKKFSSMKIDTTNTPFVVVYDVPQAPSYYPLEGKVDLEFTPKENFGSHFHLIYVKNGKQVVSFEQDRTITNDATKFEIAEEKNVEISEEFYNMNQWYGKMCFPVAHWMKATQSRKFFFDKVNKNFLFNKMLYQDKVILDGAVFAEYKINTVNAPYVFSIDHPIGVPAWYPTDGKFDLTFEPKANFGFHMIYTIVHDGVTHVSGDHDVTVVNNADKFEVNELSKQTMDEDSSFYAGHCRMSYPIPCHKQVEVARKMFVDKKNTNFLFNKMTYDNQVKLDGKVVKTVKLDTVNTPYVLTWDEPKAPIWTPSPINMFGLKKWMVTVDHKAGTSLVVTSNLADMKLTIMRKPNMFVEFIRNGETYLKASSEITPNFINTQLNTKMYFPTGSVFCIRSAHIGCYDKYEADLKVFVDLKNKNVYLNKFSINAFVKKNDETHIEFEESTKVSPYVLKINAPHMLPQLFDDPRRNTLEVTINHQEGKFLHIQTNAPEMSSFKVSTDGVQRKLELNGEELVVVDYTKADKKFKQVLQLPNGEHVTISLDWTTWDIQTNKVHMKIEAPTRKFNVDIDYFIGQAGKMKVTFHGENPMLGKYTLQRNVNWNVDANQIDAKWTGQASFAKGPLAIFSPIATDAKVNYSIANMVLNANIAKTIAGQKWGLDVSQNKISLISGRP